MTAPVEVPVRVPGAEYSVWVGEGVLDRAAELIPLPEGAEVIALVADAAASALHGERLEEGLRATGLRVERFTVEPGEASKTLATAEAVLRWMAGVNVHRGDVVVALGGGATGDLAGLCAALYNRGVAVAQVPTTVLAQVDAAIGGKTAVNLPEGKNLVGAFHQPVAVLADVATLATLPERELRSGFAEVVKHGLIRDTGILDDVLAGAGAIAARDPATLTAIIARAVAVKAAVVAADEREAGLRAVLNYGHTLGHALEAHAGFDGLRHGEAVSLGMVFAARLAALCGLADRVADHRRALEAIGLPTRGSTAPLDELLPIMARDKKYAQGLRWVLLEDLGMPTVRGGIEEETLRRAYEEIR